ncbi:MAG: hypothetical protein VW802_06870 [Rhodospirillaceae bacterium]|jgi:hypothetical protein
MEKSSKSRRKPKAAKAAIAATAAIAIFMQASPALSLVCPSTAEQHALNVRVLQTKLMVSALSCNAKPKYNSFVKRFHRELVPHGKNLRRLFHRSYGKRARYHLNKFITRLANDESAVRVSSGSQYCQNAQALFARVLSANNGYMTALANQMPFSGSHGVASCPAKKNDFRAVQRRQ